MKQEHLDKLTWATILNVAAGREELEGPLERAVAFLNKHGFITIPEAPMLPGELFKVKDRNGKESWAAKTTGRHYLVRDDVITKDELKSRYELVDWFDK